MLKLLQERLPVMMKLQKSKDEVVAVLTLAARENMLEIEGTHPTNRCCHDRLIPSFAARVIIPFAVMISLSAAVIIFSTTACVSITVSTSSISVTVCSSISWSYRLTVTTGETS